MLIPEPNDPSLVKNLFNAQPMKNSVVADAIPMVKYLDSILIPLSSPLSQSL